MIELYIATIGKSALDDCSLQFQRDHPDFAVRTLRGKKMQTLDGAFDEVSAAFQFPWYFGENFPALVDCLGDLSWLQDNVLIVVYDADLIILDSNEDRRAFYRAVRLAEERFSEPDNLLHPNRTSPASFRVVLHSDVRKVDFVKTEARHLGTVIRMIDAEGPDIFGQ